MNSKLKLILTIAGIAGTGLTAYCAVQDSRKAQKLIDKENKIHFVDAEGCAELTRKEKLKMTWRCYYKTGIAFALTAADIVYLHRVNIKDIAVITGIAAMYKAKGEAFESTVKGVVGEENYNKLKMQAAKSEVVTKAKEELKGLLPSSPNQVLVDDITVIDEDGELFWENLLGGMFRVRKERVYNAQNAIVDAILKDIPVSVGEYRDLWWDEVKSKGLKKVKHNRRRKATQLGDMVGWIGWPSHDEPLRADEKKELDFSNETFPDDDYGENITIASWDCVWYTPVVNYMEYS